MSENVEIDIQGIIKRIPHRFPFLLVDRIKHLEKDKSAIGIKNVSINESFFMGHFPDRPVMPGVLIIEALAQTAGVLVCESKAEFAHNKLVLFTSISDVKFKKIVVPGDQVELHVLIEKHKMNVWRFSGFAKVDGNVVAEANFSAMIVDK
ncbi:MAG: 3-hydroxyacyl-ACP dehydratase FabZ [Rickettsiales bacterium]|nr:3-hydroxyacyl-ACP dehydratase FabZ [Rickettsiales bacterium]